MSRRLPGIGEDNSLYAITDAKLSCGRSTMEVVEALLDAGITIIQYREKKKSGSIMLEECMAIKERTKAANACFIVNDHIDLALLCEADGVHVGQDDIPVEQVRRLVGPDMLIGLSTHSPEQAMAAVKVGADYIGVGPLYATQTKEDVCAPVGLSYLDWVVANIALPHVAIGGIKTHNVQEVVRHGAKCCALVSEFVGAADIAATVKAVRGAMKG